MMTAMQRAIARQVVLSDLSFREQADSAAVLPAADKRRRAIEAQMAKDKTTLGGWVSRHAITDAEISAGVAEVTGELLSQCSAEDAANAELELAELRAMAARLSSIAHPDEIETANAEIAALQTSHAERRAKLSATVARVQAIRAGGLKWRR